jgi:tetratricopeptide (TPR) repeat protein
MARGMPDADDFRTRAAWILGGLYQKRGGLHEAVVVWDTVAAAHPKGKDAPECLYRAIRGYLALQGRERRPLYKDLARERLTELTRLYPDHPLSSTGALIEGEQAEADGDYAGAASIYERVAAGTPSYEEALYRAGGAWSRVARAHFDKGVANEARKAVARAEELLKKARTELEAASTRTLDTNSQERLRGLAFGARTGLANLYLMKGVDRAKDVAPLFQGAEQELAAQPERMSSVWELRFRALNELGKLDEAMALFEAQVKENPAAEWLDSGARLLAPILDARGTELRKKDPRSAEADRLWRKAAANYLLAIQGQIEGRDAVQMETLEGVADRLFLFALHFEGLGETVESFVDHHGAPLSGEMLEATARAYELIVPLTPSYRTAIKLARTLGFLGRWDEASSIYAELFERESFADPVSKTINQEAVASKPELLFAYIEWGVSERNSATTSGENQRLVRASGIFEALVRGTTSGSKLWWQSKFYQLQTMFDRGEYEVADIAVKSLKLNWERYDSGEYGLEERFKKLEEELAPRVFEQKD